MQINFKILFGAALAVLVLLVVLLNDFGSGKHRGPEKAGSNSRPTTLRIYCAAGLRTAVERVREAYEKTYNVKIETDYDGSGTLLSKIRAGGKGDLYIAADESYMDDGRKYGLIEEVAPLAYQHPVLALRKNDPKTDKIRQLSDVLSNNLRISLADPDRAAISRVAKKSLAKSGHWESLWDAKLASVDTVNRVANDIVTEAADVGIIWDATAGQYDELRMIDVPELEAARQQIAIAVLSSAAQPQKALHFLRYLTSRERGLKQFEEMGYAVVDGDKWDETPELQLFSGGLNRPAIDDIVKEFEIREGVNVSRTYNGCGSLVGQMRGGARPDLYFSCDTTFMTQVDDLFPDPVDVSETDMVIIVDRSKQAELKIGSLADLANDGLRLGVCSHEHSALGFLTKRLMEKFGLWDSIQKNVRDTPATADVLVAQVAEGGLDAAIVYFANTSRQKDKLEVIRIDDEKAHAVQPIGVSNESDYKYLTGRLMDRIKSARSQRAFESLGFVWLGDTNPS